MFKHQISNNNKKEELRIMRVESVFDVALFEVLLEFKVILSYHRYTAAQTVSTNVVAGTIRSVFTLLTTTGGDP